MNDFIEAKWEDRHGVERTLNILNTVLVDEIDRVLFRAGLILENEIKKVITEKGLVDTGFYRMNWNVYVEHRLTGRAVHIWTSTKYAPHLEEGTENEDGSQRMQAYKVVETAWERAKYRITTYVYEELDEVWSWDYDIDMSY